MQTSNMLTEKQKEFIREGHHRFNIKIGATRSGKTYIDLLYTIASRIRERRNKKGITVILGVTNSTIERNILIPLREIYGDKFVSQINHKNIATIFGEKVYCLGAGKGAEVSKIRGASIKYVYCDELAEYNPAIFEMLKSRLDKEYSCMDATLNPEGKNHWLKVDFLDTIEEKGIDCYIQYYTLFDNEFLNKDFIDNLCKEYKGTVYYNRYVLGQWCDAEGIIFIPIANDENRYITEEHITGDIFIGVDWGGNGSKHSITATIVSRDYTKIQVLASDVMVSTGTNTKQVFGWIKSFIEKIEDKYWRPRAIFADSAEQVLNNSLRSEVNYPVLDSIKTPIEERIKCIIRLLNSDRISFIKGETKTIITALQTAVYDDKNPNKYLDNGTSDIDSLDSFVYSFEKWSNQLMRKKEGS